jgi:hypothetical protein
MVQQRRVVPEETDPAPFSKSLLEDGFNALAAEGLITRTNIARDPLSNKKLDSVRVLYTNRFAQLDGNLTRSQPKRRRDTDGTGGGDAA